MVFIVVSDRVFSGEKQIFSVVGVMFTHMAVLLLLPFQAAQSAGACTADVAGYWSGSAGPDTHLCSAQNLNHVFVKNCFCKCWTRGPECV